jgi:hypothetical protein
MTTLINTYGISLYYSGLLVKARERRSAPATVLALRSGFRRASMAMMARLRRH